MPAIVTQMKEMSMRKLDSGESGVAFVVAVAQGTLAVMEIDWSIS